MKVINYHINNNIEYLIYLKIKINFSHIISHIIQNLIKELHDIYDVIVSLGYIQVFILRALCGFP
jgi:hypothetical protein